MRQSKATKRNMIRLWTLLLCLIVAFAMIQPLGGSYAYAAAAGIGSGSEASNNDGEAASGSAGGDERGSLRNSPAVWYDGTYEGTGNGYEGPVKLAVTIAGGKITEIKDVEQKETPEYWVKALPVIQTIIDSQSTAVDSISGATVSCDAIKAAVNEALDLAALDPDGPFSSGKGTVKKPYIIDTVKGLQTFAEAVDDGISYSGQYIALGGDLDLSGIENWNPIGGEGPTASASKFAGNFNGKGHVIRGMTIEGEYYVGGVVDELKAFTTETYQTIAEAMNDKYAEFPIDIALYGLEADALNKWEYTSTDADAEDSSGADAGNTPADSSQSQGSTGGTDLTGLVKLSAAKAQTSYKQPSVEIVPPEPEVLRDGTWYGRSEVTSEADPVDAAAGSQTGNGDAANNESGNAAAGASESGAPGAADSRVIVKITVKDGAIVGDPEVISGDTADTEAVEEAAAVARTKSVYGDATGYGQASADLFAGGKGTKEAPYLIENEKQLRAIAEAINEDESFRDVYFRQTSDIDVSSEDWLPIGHGITAMIKAT